MGGNAAERRRPRAAGRLALLAAAAVAVFALSTVLRRLESRMIFYPTRELLLTPGERGLDYESVEITTGDGLLLHGWWVPASRQRGVLLFFHGNAGNIGDRVDSIEIFHRLGLGVLIVDYRGYGRSEGEPSEEGTYEDAGAAWMYLTQARGVDRGRVVVFGRSLGAAVATHLVTALGPDRGPAALILESAFTSVADMAATVFPFLPARLLIRMGYDNLDRVGRIACPVLVLHSRGDEIVPFEHGRKLYEAIPGAKAFVEMRGGHNDGFIVSGRAYVDGLDAFLSEHLERDGTGPPS